MMPFVGNDYESSKHKKLLLVGESFYLPEGATVHHDANSWYGAPVLTSDELDWCNTCGTREGKSGRFGKEIDRCLNLVQPSGGNGWHQVAFLNYFLRPADCTTGIVNLWGAHGGKEADCKFAVRNFIEVLEILEPELFLFLSSRVCWQAEGCDYPKYFGGELWNWTKSHGIEYSYTRHPSSVHWNLPMTGYSKAHGMTSRDFFCSWLKEKWLK
jgi:hypothetical protein